MHVLKGVDGLTADEASLKGIAEIVCQGRYNNMLRLLGSHFSEEKYLEVIQSTQFIPRC